MFDGIVSALLGCSNTPGILERFPLYSSKEKDGLFFSCFVILGPVLYCVLEYGKLRRVLEAHELAIFFLYPLYNLYPADKKIGMNYPNSGFLYKSARPFKTLLSFSWVGLNEKKMYLVSNCFFDR